MFDEEERESWLLFFNWSCYVCIFDCVLVVPLVSLLSVIVAISGQTHSFSLLMSSHGKYQCREI